MSDDKKTLDTLDNIIELHSYKPEPPALDSLTYSYTYIGEHYDHIPSNEHWTRQFASTELAVGITEAISYAARDGLTNADIAIVLDKILSEVKRR
jgi:hypothetical protein